MDQYSGYIANQTSSFFGVPETEAEKEALAAYLNHRPKNIIKTAEDAADFFKFTAIARQKHLLPREKKLTNARKRRIIDDDHDGYLLDTEDISPDNLDLKAIIEDIREDAEEATEKDEKRQLNRLAKRIEETVGEDHFRETFELLQGSKEYDASRGRVNLLTDEDVRRICQLMEPDNDSRKPINQHDLQIIHSLLVDNRQLAIFACIYRKWTPAQLRQKLEKLELKLVSWGIIGQTRTRTDAVFANELMHLDKKGNIPFDFTAIVR